MLIKNSYQINSLNSPLGLVSKNLIGALKIALSIELCRTLEASIVIHARSASLKNSNKIAPPVIAPYIVIRSVVLREQVGKL